jgi:hypothetical protein
MQLYDKYSFKAIFLPTIIVLSSPIINVYLLIALSSLAPYEIGFSLSGHAKIIAMVAPVLLYLIALSIVRTSGRT